MKEKNNYKIYADTLYYEKDFEITDFYELEGTSKHIVHYNIPEEYKDFMNQHIFVETTLENIEKILFQFNSQIISKENKCKYSNKIFKNFGDYSITFHSLGLFVFSLQTIICGLIANQYFNIENMIQAYSALTFCALNGTISILNFFKINDIVTNLKDINTKKKILKKNIGKYNEIVKMNSISQIKTNMIEKENIENELMNSKYFSIFKTQSNDEKNKIFQKKL